jgi:hypothetical protein
MTVLPWPSLVILGRLPSALSVEVIRGTCSTPTGVEVKDWTLSGRVAILRLGSGTTTPFRDREGSRVRLSR